MEGILHLAAYLSSIGKVGKREIKKSGFSSFTSSSDSYQGHGEGTSEWLPLMGTG